jgi:hypothetical protein
LERLILGATDRPHNHVPKTGGTWVRAAIAAAGIEAHESGPPETHDRFGVFDLPA